MQNAADGGHPVDPFVRKLAHGATLSEADRAVLARFAEPARRRERGDILQEGANLQSVVLVLEGWVYRYRQLENGMRQITTLYMPGDLCEPFGAVSPRMNHALAAATPVTLALVPPQALREATLASPQIEKALWWDLLLSDTITREHAVSLGRRSATERLAYCFCEVRERLEMVGLTQGESFAFPLTQAELADMFGLSTVHVNRSLQELRRTGLVSLQGRRATIHDLATIREMAMFDVSLFHSDVVTRSAAGSTPPGRRPDTREVS